MNKLQNAFMGPGGIELLAWCVQNGKIHDEIGENPTELAEHNLVKRLLHEAGIRILPIIPRNQEDKVHVEENLIDAMLEGDY